MSKQMENEKTVTTTDDSKTIEELRQEIIDLKIALHDISGMMQYFQDKYYGMANSFSYKFGRKVTFLPRMINRLVRGK